MPTHVRSHCKINLGLAIGPPRTDGFHALATLYQTLALHDVVTVSARRLGAGEASWLALSTNHPQVPTDSRNTAWKMARWALERAGVSAEVTIHIQKDLPVQGGLGAGSANAAAALIGLERELGLTLSEADRLTIAAEVGSDVPLFLVGGAVLGRNRGEDVAPLRDFPPTRCVVAIPEVGVSTPLAFKEWDGLCAAKANQTNGADAPNGLTGPGQPDRLEKLSHVYASVLGVSPSTERASESSGIVHDEAPERKRGGSSEPKSLNDLAGNPLLALVRTGIENDFEQVVFPQYPLLREIKHLLMGSTEAGAIYAALSGSGSALFGLYRNEEDAKAAQQRVQASGCKALLTETLPRPEYWRTMFAE
jgi:4-diphosphocytidyl-2-C-methyl-D-erythritol kinase